MKKLKCSYCGRNKLENEFSRDRHSEKLLKQGIRKTGRIGRTYDCLVCIKKRHKKYLEEHPDIRAKINARKRKEYRNPEERKKQRNAVYKCRYGISLTEYEEKLRDQNNVCAICQRPNDTKHHFHIDHNHGTGQVRGLLCIRCNTIIGSAHENIAILHSAVAYLKHHSHLDSA